MSNNKNLKPISKYLPDFLDYLEIEKGLSSNTQKNYDRFLKKFFLWLEKNNLQELKPHDLTDEHIWQYKVFLSRNVFLKKNKKSLKKNTQNSYLITLRCLLNFFVKKNIPSLPPDKIVLIKDKEKKQIHFLTHEQIEKLLQAPNQSNFIEIRDRAILETLFSTGLRVAELVSLNREQIKIKRDKEHLELTIIGKGGKIRTTYLSNRAIFALKRYLLMRQDKNKALFVNKKKQERLTVRSIENIIKKYAITAGLPILTTPHTLRHSFASDLLSQGVDLRTIQEFLGHQSISTTQIYTHITNKRLKDIHKKFHSGSKLENRK
jgi:site-specific recombinase XerD